MDKSGNIIGEYQCYSEGLGRKKYTTSNRFSTNYYSETSGGYMRVILLFSNLKLTEYLLSNHTKLKKHALYFQFHFISFFLLISLFNLKFNDLLNIFIIFFVGEAFLAFNYVYNKNNLKRYLLTANFFLYGMRLFLIFLSILFDNKGFNSLPFYILLIGVSIYKPLFQIKLLTKEIKFSNFIVIYLYILIRILFGHFLPTHNYFLFSLTFLVIIFGNIYTFGFNRLLYLFDDKINKSEFQFYKQELEEKKRLIDLLVKNDNNIKLNDDNDIELITGYDFRQLIINLLFFLFLLIMIPVIIHALYFNFDRVMNDKLFFTYTITLFILLTFGLIAGIFANKNQFKYHILKFENQLSLIVNHSLNPVNIENIGFNKYCLGLNLYRIEVNQKRYSFLINSYDGAKMV